MRETHIISSDSTEWIVGPCAELAASGIFMTGISTAGSRFEFVRLGMAYPQLLVTVSGQGTAWVAGKWQPCYPGSAYITPANVRHAYHNTPGVPWHFVWVLYQPRSSCPISTPEPALIKLDPRPIHDTVGGLYREVTSQNAGVIVHGWVQLLQLYCERLLGQAPSADTLWPVWDMIASDLSRRWTLNALAKAAGVSCETFRRLSQSQLGRAPMKHVNELRLRRASALLAATSLKIESIARQVGYANRFAFSHAFTRQYHVSPALYRNRHGVRQAHPKTAGIKSLNG